MDEELMAKLEAIISKGGDVKRLNSISKFVAEREKCTQSALLECLGAFKGRDGMQPGKLTAAAYASNPKWLKTVCDKCTQSGRLEKQIIRGTKTAEQIRRHFNDKEYEERRRLGKRWFGCKIKIVPATPESIMAMSALMAELAQKGKKPVAQAPDAEGLVLQPERWRSVQDALDAFCAHLSRKAPRLRIEPLNDRSWSYAEYLAYLKTRPFNQPGVYLIYGFDEKLRWVGVATGSFHDRIWSHDEHIERCFTDVIVFDDEHSFLAPALELFLIRRLKPPGNTHHVGRRQAEPAAGEKA